MRSREYHLVEQGLHKLKTKEKKESIKVEITYITEVESINTPNPHLLPLSGSFNFDFFFSILPNIISNNTLILFL